MKSVYRVQYFCPLESDQWQWFKDGVVFKTPKTFPSLELAAAFCDSYLVWRYHSSRVIDPAGNVVYQI